MSVITRLQPIEAVDSAAVSGGPRPVLLGQARQPRQHAVSVVVPPAASSVPVAGNATTDDEDPLDARVCGIARSVAQGSLEVLGGTRPLQQLAKWLDPDSYERLQLRANLIRCIAAERSGTGLPGQHPAFRVHRNVVVRSVRVCCVKPAAYEAAVVVFDQKRVRAVALRIEQRRGSWRVTALEIG
ncbi:hypothetical protein IWX65_000022 [Arthrobacter sp. CAN_A214]|uniref:Rv3235 family protein n=1 Tax=Arthrobacter sp. CAN_A214 TaxID=2787720 RepID=UPI001A1D63EC